MNISALLCCNGIYLVPPKTIFKQESKEIKLFKVKTDYKQSLEIVVQTRDTENFL